MKSLFQFEECKHKFTKNKYLKLHIKNVHEVTKFSCDLCIHKFSRQSNIKAHISIIQTNLIFKCYCIYYQLY